MVNLKKDSLNMTLWVVGRLTVVPLGEEAFEVAVVLGVEGNSKVVIEVEAKLMVVGTGAGVSLVRRTEVEVGVWRPIGAGGSTVVVTGVEDSLEAVSGDEDSLTATEVRGRLVVPGVEDGSKEVHNS